MINDPFVLEVPAHFFDDIQAVNFLGTKLDEIGAVGAGIAAHDENSFFRNRLMQVGAFSMITIVVHMRQSTGTMTVRLAARDPHSASSASINPDSEHSAG